MTSSTLQYADHLTPALLARAQRALVAKAISEFSHERLLEPVRHTDRAPEEPKRMTHGYSLAGPTSTYTFTARVHALDHWVLDLDSLTRTVDGVEQPLDAQAFVAEFADQLGIPPRLLPTYLEELASTLAAACWKLAHSTATADDLVRALSGSPAQSLARSSLGSVTGSYQAIEAAMTEGHPAFVANNGRIGFGADDYAAYAPEAGRPVHLLWLAVRRDAAHLATGRGVDERTLYRDELGEETLAAFEARLTGLGLDPADYLHLPVHPWQWMNKLAITFAPDLARRDLVVLGEGTDDHRPQQSIRTFFNTTRPERHYVKTALSIQNMGFMRGLSPAYMRATPAINDWVADLVEGDPELKECGFGVLRELASIGWTGDVFHALPDPSPYRKMIAALWRESPLPHLADGERLATMASLLHRDADGRSLAAALVRASGRAPAEWVRSYLRAYVRPIVHCLLAHDLAFMPHGENLVMVLEDHVPVRMIMKDIGEEVAVMGDQPLPAEVARIRGSFPDDVKALALHTDVFDGFLRYFAAILDEDGVLPDEEFWVLVAETIDGHAGDHPELAGAAAAYDLARPEFRHSCLNRLQLRNTLQMVDLTDQAESLIFAGTLSNPIARSR